ncbi:MAG: hypothetical protein J7513_14385 [Solirubrobacteraceae bacterium]|nr:hypothetical protein [Solirubrobacteraceae bacterium]
MRPPATRLVTTGAFLATSATLLALSPHALMVLLPALVLAWMVTIGWFTGERAIALVRRVMRRLRPRRPSTLPGLVRQARRAAVVAGRLLAGTLASRPPPTRLASA